MTSLASSLDGQSMAKSNQILYCKLCSNLIFSNQFRSLTAIHGIFLHFRGWKAISDGWKVIVAEFICIAISSFEILDSKYSSFRCQIETRNKQCSHL